MIRTSQTLALLGSTGSIGRSTLEVVAASRGKLRVDSLAAHRNFELLVEQARRFKPRFVLACDGEAAADFDWSALPTGVELLAGEDAVRRLVTRDEVDTVVAAIVGSAGLIGAWAALEAGKKVALANKEALVMGGPLVTKLARDHDACILPIDSEHSAVFQCLQCGERSQVRRVILTASGGPFRNHSAEQLRHVTVAEALRHPTWAMGPKITIDSATMMNKALEIIEARWLFGLAAEQIEVVVHPQSIVHSLVEFVDGSIVAQMSSPDMKLPIQYALTYPDRWEGISRRLDWREPLRLDFEPPDGERFPAIELGLEVARSGGACGAVLNAANETAVAEFLAGRLDFVDIVPLCRSILEHHPFESEPTLERLFELDRWARQEALRWVGT